MRNHILAGSMMVIMLLGGAGCSTSDNYCCTSNDQCLTTSEGLHSCSMDTCGKCVVVTPLTITITSPGGWKDPNVGQNNYSVELDASGGIPPYTWGDFTIVNDTGGKLSWLTFKTDANDSSKAYLTNRVENNVVSVPSQPTEDNETLSIKVTVMDNTRHGKDTTRLDDVGYPFSHPIAINECPQTCINDDGCCPTGCNILTDSDCPVTCGDGVVSVGETCDITIAAGLAGACPTSCTAPNVCTTSTLQNAGTCTAACVNTPITTCVSGGGCCPYSIEDVKFNMIYVPGGTFPTGTNDLGGNQTVTAFWMGETDVTYELWSAVYTWATSNGYTFANPGRQGGDLNTGPIGTNQNPVTTINWRDAMVWSNAASELAGLSPVYYTDAGYTTPIRSVDNSTTITTVLGTEDNPYVNSGANGFQLPGSIEWECAARYQGSNATNALEMPSGSGIYWTKGNHASGDTSSYCYPADSGTSTVFGNYAWYSGNSNITTHDVATKQVNTLGIYDMNGNVWEWCFDWSNGSGRVVRGGSWDDVAFHLQVGDVIYYLPSNRVSFIGFRLVKTK